MGAHRDQVTPQSPRRGHSSSRVTLACTPVRSLTEAPPHQVPTDVSGRDARRSVSELDSQGRARAQGPSSAGVPPGTSRRCAIAAASTPVRRVELAQDVRDVDARRS